ncbi:sodium/glutamate symporter [Candidatus Laterigemmans baculatus]|uniref:sodium/glutamate symporter n=1 Tax=Candidatus Laterigemmans baculatus TaxID=2770505 RepID=UPI0013DB807E|nr:sodium/glutamate symporter [Candidatus Laterigemmans baculatus]
MTLTLIFVAVLLLVGVLLRMYVPLFRWLYIPASVIAGSIGLAIVSYATLGVTFADSDVQRWGVRVDQTLQSWPGWLIAVVFAGLLLERQTGLRGENVRRALREGLMVWIIVLGQTATGLLITWLLIRPFYDLPNSIGMLIETGFAGGHGTAAAMGQVFTHPEIGLAAGRDLGMLMATAGLVYGIVSGIVWINIGVRAGWVSATVADSAAASGRSGVAAPPVERTPIGYSVIDHDVLDPLLLQMVWLALAFGIGLGLQTLVGLAAEEIDRVWMAPAAASSAAPEVAADDAAPSGAVGDSGEAGATQAGEAELGRRMNVVAALGSFPLFIYTLFGGGIVRLVLHQSGRGDWIDAASLQRLTAVAMDILVVAAISSLDLIAVASLWVPFTLLFIGGVVWTAICLLGISRRVLPREHWFELGLINYGMSTGVTATGFVLLRIVDPELRTAAAEDYALAAPLSAPFIGGGVLTIALPLLVLERVPIAATAVGLAAVVAGLIWYGVRIAKRARGLSTEH